MAKPNYYEILALPQDQDESLPELVKKAYRKALLLHHPDKNPKAGDRTSSSTDVTVDEIALAYKTLSEPSLRAEYDRWLASNHHQSIGSKHNHHIGLETVDLDDLVFEEKSESWTRGCRCGTGGFEVTEAELEKNLEDRELIVGCKGCSLWLRVLFSVEE